MNATGGHDVFTLDFDHPLSSVTLTYTGTTIHIQGVATGGRDVGGSYASDAFLGLYTIDFLYTLGVMPVMGDDDVWVNTANHVNSGSIVLPDASVVSLVDERGATGSRCAGRRGTTTRAPQGRRGISGWGWMSYAGASVVHVESTDWLFTMTRNIPTPGSAALGLMGLAVFTRASSRDTRAAGRLEHYGRAGPSGPARFLLGWGAGGTSCRGGLRGGGGGCRGRARSW